MDRRGPYHEIVKCEVPWQHRRAGENIVYDLIFGFDGPAYCAGCNGSFILDFRHTSVGTSKGVYGVGFDFVNNGPPLYSPQYTAFITFGDKSSVNELLP